MDSQIEYVNTLIEEILNQRQQNDEFSDREEETKKEKIRIINKKIRQAYKRKVLNPVEIINLRDEKNSILSEYNHFNYIGLQCDKRIRRQLSNLYDQLNDLKNGNCEFVSILNYNHPISDH